MNPLVSVCIPTYRGAAHIAEAIQSVLDQTYTNFELIVVDDCSPDQTPDVVASFQDPRIRYLRNSVNLGPEGNWNRCLELASGAFFKLLPHDDLLYPECLGRQVAVLSNDTAHEIALVTCRRDIISPTGRIIGRRGYPTRGDRSIAAHSAIRRCLLYGTNLLGEPGATLFRRSTASTVGRFDATNPYVIDLDYWFRLLRHGQVYFLSDSLAAFRISGDSWSVALGSRQRRDFLRLAGNAVQSGEFGLSQLEFAAATVMATANQLLRMLVYRLTLRRKSRP